MDLLVGQLDANNSEQILTAIKVFDKVRGYGHVRAASMLQARTQLDQEMAKLKFGQQAYAA
jgi:hypothetical protein